MGLSIRARPSHSTAWPASLRPETSAPPSTRPSSTPPLASSDNPPPSTVDSPLPSGSANRATEARPLPMARRPLITGPKLPIWNSALSSVHLADSVSTPVRTALMGLRIRFRPYLTPTNASLVASRPPTKPTTPLSSSGFSAAHAPNERTTGSTACESSTSGGNNASPSTRPISAKLTVSALSCSLGLFIRRAKSSSRTPLSAASTLPCCIPAKSSRLAIAGRTNDSTCMSANNSPSLYASLSRSSAAWRSVSSLICIAD